MNSFVRFAVVVLLALWPLVVGASELSVTHGHGVPQAVVGAGEIRKAVEDLGGGDLGVRFVLGVRSDADFAEKLAAAGAKPVRELRPEGFSIRVAVGDGRKTIWVIGEDRAGLLYGAFEVAERIRIGALGKLADLEQEPYMAMRGVKFNIPLDVRTPSYTDVCDAAQQNIGEVWSMEFWKGMIDALASHRYNFVSMWSLHPFPSMVRVPEYPDVALADVQRSTGAWKETYSLNGIGFDAPEIVNKVETLKKMSIDEKMDFWREVMAYGAARNVRFYVVTWNLFVNGARGKHGITESLDSPVTTDYFRKSVTAMFREYPLLAGVGLTTGENMHGASVAKKEDWAWKTYGLGVLDAAEEMPDRQFALIHRQHQTGAREIAEKFQPLVERENVEFIFSFKYAKAHVMSSTTQTYHPGFVKDLGRDLKTIWTLRNDDAYHYRWGAPDFVREFVRNIPHEVSRGFYYGSDQWIWGREFLAKKPEAPRLLEVEKHWFHWLLWGRLGYDPNLDNERLEAIIAARFPGVDAGELLEAWQAASMTYPLTTGFHWGALDFQWFIEGCISQPKFARTKSGFHDIERFITLAPHPGTDNVGIPDYVKAVAAGKKVAGTTPLEVAAKLNAHANGALELLTKLRREGDADPELARTLSDIESMALLGRYYALKIEGAALLALFRETGQAADKARALVLMTSAQQGWDHYAELAAGKYRNPLWTNRVGHVDWEELKAEVARDVEIVRKARRRK